MKACHEVIPPKLIVSVPKPDNRKIKATSSPLDGQTQRQIEMVKGTQHIDSSVDKPRQININKEEKNSPATSKPFCTQGDSAFTSPSGGNISKKIIEISHKDNINFDLLPKTNNKASDILPWQKVSQKQEYRKPDTDFSPMISNDSKYPTEVEKWAVHSPELSKDGAIPLSNEQNLLKRFQQASPAGALKRPDTKFIQPDSTAQKLQHEIYNPAYVSDFKSSFLDGNQELAKKVYDSKVYDSKFELAKEREAQVAVLSEGKENKRKKPETEKASKPDVYRSRGLRRRECPKGLIRLNL